MENERNFYKEIFPYDEIPKVTFSSVGYERNLPDDIWVTDTTFRDGQQSMASFTVEQVTTLFDYLHKIDNNSGVIRQTEFFLYSKRDREAVRACQERGYRFPEITSWIRATKNDFQLVKEMNIPETGILMSCSDYHVYTKLGWDREKALKNYAAILSDALDAGIRPRCHLEDLTRADVYGFVLPLVKHLNKLGQEAGVKVKFRACDTLGLGVPYHRASLPRSVQALISILRNEAGLDAEQLEWHGHNDYYGAVPNATTAWLYGCAGISSTLLGIGERTGNTALDGMLIEYMQIKGDKELRLDLLAEVADYFKNELDYAISVKHPFIGADFNATKAGIHADGILKDEEIYNSFDTEKILGRPIVIQVNEFSGAAGVAAWINGYYRLTGEEKLNKRSEGVTLIKDEIANQYDDGRESAFSTEELVLLTEKHLPQVTAKFKS